MSSCTRNVRFELRRNTKLGWNPNFILLAGEPGTETDTGQMKVGDGVTPWNLLPYVGGGESGGPTGHTGYTGYTGYTGATGATGATGVNSFATWIFQPTAGVLPALGEFARPYDINTLKFNPTTADQTYFITSIRSLDSSGIPYILTFYQATSANTVVLRPTDIYELSGYTNLEYDVVSGSLAAFIGDTNDVQIFSSIIGPTGPTGATGATGVTGVTGATGHSGEKGDQGERGYPYNVDGIGPGLVTPPGYVGPPYYRDYYDSQPDGFAYFDTTAGLLYIKQSDTSGDWTEGFPFGKGDMGSTGPTGYTGGTGQTGPTGNTGPTGPAGSIIFDGGNPSSVYDIGPVFDCGTIL